MSNGGYERGSGKVLDFVIGFFGAVVLAALAIATGGMLDHPWPAIVGAGLGLAGIVIAFMRQRFYIAIGMLSVLVLPLLAFGACFLMLR